MQYKFSVILDLADRAFGMGSAKKIKPITWEVGPEQLHRFMVCILEDHKVIKKVEVKPKKTMDETDKFLKPKKKKATKRKRK